MSRASAVRDALVAELTSRLSGPVVEAFLVPDYQREELEKQLRVGVRNGGREFEVDEDGGPDRREITIEVGVIGLTPQAEGKTTKATHRREVLKQADEYDALMEQIIALYTPSGPLRRCGMAEHRFVGISQPQAFDAKQLYDNGVWVALVEIKYTDQRDDDEET